MTFYCLHEDFQTFKLGCGKYKTIFIIFLLLLKIFTDELLSWQLIMMLVKREKKRTKKIKQSQ